MPNLLIELFSEEIPARLQARAAADFERLMAVGLKEAGLEWDTAETFYGPRRLTLRMDGLPAKSPDTREERKGPKVGAPQKAIDGFLRGAGLSDISEAQVQETKKGEVYVAVIETKGRDTTEVLAEVLKKTITDFPWPKSQRWGDGDLKWVRPLRSVLFAFDGKAVPLTLDNGSQPIEAGLMTSTHRVLGNGDQTAVNFQDYESVLANGKIMLRAEDRKVRILEKARDKCRGEGLELVEDDALLNEVAGLAEWPLPHVGTFDEKFLTLPDEVITAAMRGHQKYFSVRDPKTGRLAPRFICVADIDAAHAETMMVGYERVLTARLSDALFLYKNDLKKPLEQHAEKLSGVTFLEGLGTIADKVERVAALARKLAPACGADPDKAEKAARLAKADLASEMVYEFPELQGLMGRYYALEQGVEPDVADAIRDHYKPQGQADDLPTNAIGVAVSLADKLDTLAAFWSIDQKPTGSRDPFALRRAALSIILITLVQNLRFPMANALAYAMSASTGQREGKEAAEQAESFAKTMIGEHEYRRGSISEADREAAVRHAYERFDPAHDQIDGDFSSRVEAWTTDLLAFFHDRLSVYFRDQGFRHDRVAAALTEGADDFVLVEKRLRALSDFLDTEEGENLSAGYKRAANILKAEAKKGDLPDAAPRKELLEQNEERALFDALEDAETDAKARLEEEDFAGAMTALAALRPVIDAYFEAVTVNADNNELRENRLAQLLRFRRVVNLVADFDRLEG